MLLRRFLPKLFTRSGDTAAALSVLTLLLDPKQRVFDSSSLQVFHPKAPFRIHAGSWDTHDLPLPFSHSRMGVEMETPACQLSFQMI
jgi:hypothetical protein